MFAEKLCQTEHAISHRRGGRLGIAYGVPRKGHRNTFYQQLGSPRENIATSRCLNGPFLHALSTSGGKFSKPIGRLRDEGKHACPFPLSTICSINPRQIFCWHSQCYISSYSTQSKQLQSIVLTTCSGYSKHVKKLNRTCTYYKSEEYDITDAKVDSLTSIEESSEAVLVEGNVPKVSPWWEQFPKRWVIVLLCFTAFLLCNMDRVGIFMDIFVLLYASSVYYHGFWFWYQVLRSRISRTF